MHLWEIIKLQFEKERHTLLSILTLFRNTIHQLSLKNPWLPPIFFLDFNNTCYKDLHLLHNHKPGQKYLSNEVRMIMDCSRPPTMNASAYIDLEHYKYVTVDDAANLCQPGCWLAKVALKNAYRSVGTHPDSWQVTGMSWCFNGSKVPTYLVISASLLEPGHPQWSSIVSHKRPVVWWPTKSILCWPT